MKKVIAMVLAGGKGERLYPLTRDRAKPAVSFGAVYRIIDFTLSNCVNSFIRKIYLITQYKSLSLERHIQIFWSNILSSYLGEFITTISAQQRINENWYQGTADAIFQNIYTLQHEQPDLVLILSGDHIYKMDYRDLINYHLAVQADLTVATIKTHKDTSREFGVLQVNENSQIIGFQEKPAVPTTLPDNADSILINMGVYVFNTGILVKRLIEDAKKKDSQHDFGKNIIPAMIKRDRLFSFEFIDKKTGKSGYWKDVGTIDAYWEASMDLLSENPGLHFNGAKWPFFAYEEYSAPAKIEGYEEKDGVLYGVVLNSIIAKGCFIRKAQVERSIISPNVSIDEYSTVQGAILMNNVTVGKNCHIKKAIIDKRVKIPDGTEIGFNLKDDAKRFNVTDSGLVIVPTNTIL